MNATQREKQLKRIFDGEVCNKFPISVKNSQEENPLLALSSFPVYTLTRAWEGSEQLITSTSTSSSNNVCLSPGCSSRNEWLVKSGNPRHKQPYFVECKSSGQIVCETGCVSYSATGLCMHTVAVARYTQTVDSLLKYLGKQKKAAANITQLCNVDMPKHSGKKPQSKRKASQKSSTKKIRELVDSVDRSNFTSRVQSSRSTVPAQESSLLSADCVPHMPTAGTSISESYSTVQGSPYAAGLDYCSTGYSPYYSYFPSTSGYYFPSTSNAGPLQDHEKQPFILAFVRGNISRCIGCGLKDLRQIDEKPHPPPGDLCIQHKENVIFENPRSGNYQLSKDKRNVYYHARFFCITKKCPDFGTGDLKIPSDVKTKLSDMHKMYISQEFHYNF